MRVVQTLQRGLAVLDYLAESRRARCARRTSPQRFDIDKANASRLLTDAASNPAMPSGPTTAATCSAARCGGRQRRQLEGRDRASRAHAFAARRAWSRLPANAPTWRCWSATRSGTSTRSPRRMRSGSTTRSARWRRSIARRSARPSSPSCRQPRPATLARYTGAHHDRRRSGSKPISRRRASDGYAIDDEEFSPGVRCVAAPIREPTRGTMVAAVGLSGPTARIDVDRLADLGRLVRDRSSEHSTARGSIGMHE